MEVLGEKVPITNGEAFAIIRANRDLRNLKCLPHFHMQSICSSSTSGSSAQQALRQKHMFLQRNQQFAVDEVRNALVGSTSIIAENQIHNAVAYTEIKVLKYLREERLDFGPSSLLLSHIATPAAIPPTAADASAAVDDGINSESERKKKVQDDEEGGALTAAASTSLSVIAGAEGSFCPGVVGGSSTTPALFYYQNTAKNISTLSSELTQATTNGQKRLQGLLGALKVRALSAQGLLDIVKQALWKSKLRQADVSTGESTLVSQSDKSVADLEGISYVPASSMLARKFKSVSETTLASAIATFLGIVSNQTGHVDDATLKLMMTPIDALQGNDVARLLPGLRTRPSTARDLVNLRNSLTAIAHVASVMPEQVAALTQLAAVLANVAITSAAQGSTTAGVLKEVARKSQQLTTEGSGFGSSRSSPAQQIPGASATVGGGGLSSQPLSDSSSALPHPMSIYRLGPHTPSLGPMGVNGGGGGGIGLDETSQSPPPSILNDGEFDGDSGDIRDEIDVLDAVLLNLFCSTILEVAKSCSRE